jgi:hypothetical protein
MRRIALLCSTLALLVVPAAAQAQAVSLTGETLTSLPGAGGGGVPVTDIQGTCTRTVVLTGDAPGSESSSFEYSVSGVAAGPYPGTFTETGSFTLGPIDEEFIPGQFRGNITDFEAEYTITSELGTIQGTKSLDPGRTSLGACFNYGTAPFNRPEDFAGQTIAHTLYEATITLPDGSQYTDTGQSTASFNYCNDQIGCGTSSSNQFSETYLSQNLVPVTPPPPAAPTTKKQCQKDGFRDFPALGFKNQGDCVAFIETAGKNEPGKNVPGTA